MDYNQIIAEQLIKIADNTEKIAMLLAERNDTLRESLKEANEEKEVAAVRELYSPKNSDSGKI